MCNKNIVHSINLGVVKQNVYGYNRKYWKAVASLPTKNTRHEQDQIIGELLTIWQNQTDVVTDQEYPPWLAAALNTQVIDDALPQLLHPLLTEVNTILKLNRREIQHTVDTIVEKVSVKTEPINLRGVLHDLQRLSRSLDHSIVKKHGLTVLQE